MTEDPLSILQQDQIAVPRFAALGALDPMLDRSSSPGVGAWSFGYYRYGFDAIDDPRKRAGVVAVKRALVDNGFGSGIRLDVFKFGWSARARTVEFQRAKGLVADGVIGPTTARYLWRHYARAAEAAHSIPDYLLGKLGTGESNNDPVAEGVVDREDEGELQFHLPYWPGVSIAQAWDPTFVFPAAAEKFAGNYTATGSWKAALAAWNIGTTYARMWREAGYPASGGPSMGTDANGDNIDSYVRATHYVAYVEALPY